MTARVKRAWRSRRSDIWDFRRWRIEVLSLKSRKACEVPRTVEASFRQMEDPESGTPWQTVALGPQRGRRVFTNSSRSPPGAKETNPQGLTLGVVFWAPGGDLLSRGQSALSSAQSRFTVLFGMGRRGSNSLWPPSKTVQKTED